MQNAQSTSNAFKCLAHGVLRQSVVLLAKNKAQIIAPLKSQVVIELNLQLL